MTKRLKLALLGCGDVAQRDYLPEFHRLAHRADLVAVCGRTGARTQQVADKYGIPNWYTDYGRMLVETEIDAIINLTPIPVHAETTLMALNAGKHVYSEKPVATSIGQAEALRATAQDRNLVLICAPSVLLFPQIRAARELVESNAIGSIYSIIGQGFGGVPPWRGYPSDPSPFFAKGAGPLADMGVYPLHAITGLFGPAQQVSAMSARAQEEFLASEGPARGMTVPIEVDDTWHVMLKLEGGRLATILSNNSSVGSRAPQLELLGLRGTIALSLLDVSSPLFVSNTEGAWEEVNVPHDRSSGPDHLLGVEHLLDCIEQDRAPIASIDHALHVLTIIDAANRSATSGQHVALAPTS